MPSERATLVHAIILLTAGTLSACGESSPGSSPVSPPKAMPESTDAASVTEITQPASATDSNTGRTGLVDADQAWIEGDCPREHMGPALWKLCTERNLAALQTGMPELGALTKSERAWIEDDCPREHMGPALWKLCTERNLAALQTGMPELGALTKSERAWIEDDCPREHMGPALWKLCTERNVAALKGGIPDLNTTPRHIHGSTVPETAAETQPKEEELNGSSPAVQLATNTLPDPPRLKAPADGERWFCYTQSLRMLRDGSPDVVLTREPKTDQPHGKGRVLVANVIEYATFRVQGIKRRWEWNERMDSISIKPDGTAGYYDFRTLEAGETTMPPTTQLWCELN